jgi:hypothetical protein
MKMNLFLFYFRHEQDSNNAQCQKCLEKGHWTYQCTRKRKYIERPSRTQLLEKRVKQIRQDRLDEEKKNHDIANKYDVLFRWIEQ